MTTWTEVADQSTAFDPPADVDNRYVEIGYILNGYFLPEGVWNAVSSVETDWT